MSPRKKTQRYAKYAGANWHKLNKMERLSIVCRKFCSGLTMKKIADEINVEFGTKFSREFTYPMIQEAVRNGWIYYSPPPEYQLTHQLKEKYPWLRDIIVVQTSQFEDVAEHGAKTIISLLKKKREEKHEKVHIGFAGGHSMQRLAQILARHLREPNAELPGQLVLQALVACFEIYEPTTDPNTFFTLFQSNEHLGPNCEFIGLTAPAIVATEDFHKTKEADGIKESFEQVEHLDIIVTSAANWSDEHSTFRKRMGKSQDCFAVLNKAKCVGDMLWLPLGENGALAAKTAKRALTLVELKELPEFIATGGDVVLVLGPCAGCHSTKGDVLRAILNSKEHIISHLVVDSRTAKEVYK